MSSYPQSRAARQGLGIGARGMKGEVMVRGFKVWECECGKHLILQEWKNASRKPKTFECGCVVSAKHIPNSIYDYPSLHQKEIALIERCLNRNN